MRIASVVLECFIRGPAISISWCTTEHWVHPSKHESKKSRKSLKTKEFPNFMSIFPQSQRNFLGFHLIKLQCRWVEVYSHLFLCRLAIEDAASSPRFPQGARVLVHRVINYISTLAPIQAPENWSDLEKVFRSFQPTDTEDADIQKLVLVVVVKTLSSPGCHDVEPF